MGFPPSVRTEALVRSRRHCCVCHEFAGLFTNVHHMVQEADGGADTLENAIVLCLRCHGEVGHYNPHHPIGNRYRPAELKRHRDEWWDWCRDHPWTPIEKDPVIISHHTIKIPSGEWRTTIPFIIYNKSEKSIFDIWIKLRLGDAGVRAEEVVVANYADEASLKVPLGNYKISSDSLIISGKDESDLDTLYFLILNLPPRTSKSFNVSTRKIAAGATDREVPVQVLSFSEDPEAQVHQTDDSVALPIKPPESLRIHGLRVHFDM